MHAVHRHHHEVDEGHIVFVRFEGVEGLDRISVGVHGETDGLEPDAQDLENVLLVVDDDAHIVRTLEIMLRDSAYIHEKEAAWASARRAGRGRPQREVAPLYTIAQAEASFPLLVRAQYQEELVPHPAVRMRFLDAGHILGASSVLVEVAGRRLLFSGDLGRPDDLVMLPPENAPQADTVVIESTYGNRSHPADDVMGELGDALQRVAARGGVAVLPVFAVGRAQAILHAIGQLKQQGRIPTALPVFLDSPMAVATTDLYSRHPQAHKLNAAELQALRHVAHMVETPEASKDRKSTRLNSSHMSESRMPSSA